MSARLEFAHPEMSGRTCESCEKYIYKDEAGQMSGQLSLLESGEPQKRPFGCPTPCSMCPKIPTNFTGKERVRKNAIEPSDRSLRTLWHYQRCIAVSRFPVDPIVERNAAFIAKIAKSVQDSKASSSQYDLISTLTKMMIPRM